VDAVILAGGLGTRLRAAVSDVPKPMAPVNGRPFLELLLDYWIGQGVRRAILAVGYLHQAIRGHFGSAYRGCEIAYSVEDQPLGTGGALLQALPMVASPAFLALNGDTYFAVRLDELQRFHAEKSADVTLSLFRSDNPRYTGEAVYADGKVTGYSDKGLVNGGVFLFQREALKAPVVPCSLEKDLLARFGGRAYARVFDAPFIDIGLPEDWRAAGKVISSPVK
jgi:D-glycero-alpha-D-manno-heptose 1-phosphate guanylyltransferase